MLASELSGAQQGCPSILKTAPAAFDVPVDTITEYLVRVRIPHAVTTEQFRFTRG